MSGLPSVIANFSSGRATNPGAATFQVAEPQGDDTTSSVFSALPGAEARLDCSRRGAGTPIRRGSRPTKVGLELDAVSEASDQPMPSRSPSLSDVEMPSRPSSPSDVEMRSKSPSPFDMEMEDLSMEFGWLFNEAPGQDEEMEDLAVDLGLLFQEASSNGINASFWSGNNTALDNVAAGPGSPMDCDEREKSIPADSTIVNPMQAPSSDVNITTDAPPTIETSKDVDTDVEKRVPVHGNVQESQRHVISKILDMPEPSAIHPDSRSSSVTSLVAHEAIPTTVDQPIPSDSNTVDPESLQMSAADLEATDLYDGSQGKKIDEPPKKQLSPMPLPVISEEAVDNAAGPVSPAVPPTSANAINSLNNGVSNSSIQSLCSANT
uniref:Clathrin_bdg domain-containing protein n=1 Tax=Panagrellus redivivus TaxID=6233 RepID=A0A7E5A1U4_PANRE